MINKKNIIVISVVLVVLIGALLAVNFLLDEENTDKSQTVGESIEVYSVAIENIERIDLDVKGEKFAFFRKDGKWVLHGDESVKLKNSAVDYLGMELCSIYAQALISEGDADLSKYGLDAPACTYTLSFNDGNKKTFLMGNQDPVSGFYYFKDKDGDKVYAISESKADSLANPGSHYRDSDIIEVDVEKLSTFHMQKKGSTVTLVKTYTKDTDGATVVNWDMKSPYNKKCNTETVTDNIVSKLSYVDVKEFIDKSDSRYAASGVDSPNATITITDEAGISQTIYVGKEEGQLRYIKTGGRVYLVSNDCVSFADVDPFIYISKFIFLENIENVSSIEVTHGDITHVATIEGEDDKFVFKLDGKEVLEKTFKQRVYESVMGLLADEFAVSPAYSAPEYTIIFRLKNGTVKKMNYCRQDDRSYAVFDEGGRCEFFIRIKKLEEMFASLQDVASGRLN